jgi:hypothetical protein
MLVGYMMEYIQEKQILDIGHWSNWYFTEKNGYYELLESIINKAS